MRVRNVYRPMILGCRADEPLSGVARFMLEKKVGALAVVEGDTVAGLITERDLVRALATTETPGALRAGACASTELKIAEPEEDSRDVARRMLDAGIRHLPVVEDGRLIGMVSMRDLLALETWTA